MAQAVARALVTGFAPEERGELVPGMGMARPDTKIGEQRLGLADGQADGAARAESGLKAAE
jgi:hypothetical protein